MKPSQNSRFHRAAGGYILPEAAIPQQNEFVTVLKAEFRMTEDRDHKVTPSELFNMENPSPSITAEMKTHHIQ
jgi:hypothetical protein